MILANKACLASLDEMHQRVLLDAMGITLGVFVILGIPYSLLEVYDIVAFEAEIAALYVVLSLTFLTSVKVGMRRYR